MLLSIISPVYNVAPYLAATIESILNQSFTDFELILVDDGSTDGSGDICRRYAQADPRIVVVTQSNQGVSAARNKGVEIARGDLIGFVDSDDIIERDMYSIMIHILHRTAADVVQCSHDRATENNINARNAGNIDFKLISGPEFVKRMFAFSGADYTNQVSLCTKVFKREILGKNHFPKGQTYEDEHETYKACFFADKIALTDEVLYHYIRRENSIITGISAKKMLDKQLALYDRLQWLPPKLPQVKQQCFSSFLTFSKHILCQLWISKATDQYDSAKRLMLEATQDFRQYLSPYDKLYFQMLKHNICQGWIMNHDFAPIQNLLSNLK